MNALSMIRMKLNIALYLRDVAYVRIHGMMPATVVTVHEYLMGASLLIDGFYLRSISPVFPTLFRHIWQIIGVS